MSKELEALNDLFDLVTCQGSFEKAQRCFDIVEEALQRLETIDKSNPSEALKWIKNKIADLEDDLQHYTMVEKDKCKEHFIRWDLEKFQMVEQALLKAQEQNSTNIFKGSKEVKIEIPESSLMDYNPVKHYLKWEDLKFTKKAKEMLVKLGDTTYSMRYYKVNDHTNKVCISSFQFIEIYDIRFFNDLHLERVEE